MKTASEKSVKSVHLRWFQRGLIENGAPAEITDKQVSASSGFKDSERAYVAGWRMGVEVHEDFFSG